MDTASNYSSIVDQTHSIISKDTISSHSEPTTFWVGSGDSRQQYEVLQSNNSDTGFQSMAVAPMGADGQPDLSHIVISYSNTGGGSTLDTINDIQSFYTDAKTQQAQIAEAQKFADQVKEKYPNAEFSTTGQSHGGSLALDVAAEKHMTSTTFNSPDPGAFLSDQAKTWIVEQKNAGEHQLNNYVDKYDIISNATSDQTGSAIYVDDKPGKSIIDYHELKAFNFNADGSVQGAGIQPIPVTEIVVNDFSNMPSEFSDALKPFINDAKNIINNPTDTNNIIHTLADFTIRVETAAAYVFVTSIAGALAELSAIKKVNAGIPQTMAAGLNATKKAVLLYPYISEADINRCIAEQHLSVEENIDLAAVSAVDAIVDKNSELITKLSTGLKESIDSMIRQDKEWAVQL